MLIKPFIEYSQWRSRSRFLDLLHSDLFPQGTGILVWSTCSHSIRFGDGVRVDGAGCIGEMTKQEVKIRTQHKLWIIVTGNVISHRRTGCFHVFINSAKKNLAVGVFIGIEHCRVKYLESGQISAGRSFSHKKRK